MESTIETNTSKFCRFEVYKHSNNGLSGRIPTGRQLQTLADPSIYSNNQGLCGPPLRECANAIASTHSHTSQDDGRETLWLYCFVVAGFSFGFWISWGILFCSKMWRYAFYQYVDSTKEKIAKKKIAAYRPYYFGFDNRSFFAAFS